MTDSSSKPFSTHRSHYFNYLFGLLFFIAPAILVFCYFISHRNEFEGVAVLILLLLSWASIGFMVSFIAYKHRTDTITISSFGLSFCGAYLCGNGKRLNFGGFGHECVSKSLAWDEIEWIKYTYQNNAKWPNALFVKIKTGEVFYITLCCYFNEMSIIKEINLYKECEWGRTQEKKAFKNPDILED